MAIKYKLIKICGEYHKTKKVDDYLCCGYHRIGKFVHDKYGVACSCFPINDTQCSFTSRIGLIEYYSIKVINYFFGLRSR